MANSSAVPQGRARTERVAAERLLAELRAHDFAVLSTTDAAGQPHAAGVTYGVSPPGHPLALYVMTRRHLAKARDIARNPRVALVVPLPRRLLRFVPPATIQLRGRAEILDGSDREGTEVFRRSWLGRRILAAYARSRRRGETRVCFLRIAPDPVVHTYGVGHSAWSLRRRMEAAAGRVVLPAAEAAARPSASSPPPAGAAAPAPRGEHVAGTIADGGGRDVPDA
jgi:general stress protein 26